MNEKHEKMKYNIELEGGTHKAGELDVPREDLIQKITTLIESYSSLLEEGKTVSITIKREENEWWSENGN